MTPAAGHCRSCGAPGLDDVLTLGCTPLANALREQAQLGEAEPVFPLELAFCPHCALVQITHTVPPDQLFSRYVYFSSYSDTMVRHAQAIAERTIAGRGLDGRSLVVEIGSNDGYLLQHYRHRGVPVLGIEPAANVAETARNRHGIETVIEFFDLELARRLAGQGRCADVVHAHNVLAHVPDLNGFVSGIAAILKDDGVAIIEVPSLREMIDRVEFDTIYHEHLCYFSLSSLQPLLERNRLRIVAVERLSIHGGSLQIHAATDRRPAAEGESVRQMLREEAEAGLTGFEYYRDFARRVQGFRSSLVTMLRGLKAQGRRIAAYGASAKGATLLNYCGIGRDTLDFVIDRSTAKQGRFTPGTALPICEPKRLLEQMPDYVLLLAWNFQEEILAQQSEYRRRGGRFIIPSPSPHVV